MKTDNYDLTNEELAAQDQRFAAALVTVASLVTLVVTLAVWFLCY